MKLFAATLLTVLSLNVLASKSSIQKIIGSDDLIAVDETGSNIPEKYRGLIDAFGLISMGCSATHIGNGIVLTAGHCFWASDDVQKDQPCDDTTVAWGVRDGKDAYLTSTCESILFAQRDSIGNDFAIFKVSPVPPVAIGVELEREAAVGDQITIFSHPEELPLRWSQLCSVETPTDSALPPLAMQHKCDTNPGSSGSTILDAGTLKVVAIHDGGRLTGASEGMNYGTFITSLEVRNALKSLGF
jgi:V8-like Glu-specific endopeptidase